MGEEVMKSVYNKNDQLIDTMFDELDEVESNLNLTLTYEVGEEGFFNCIPRGFVTRIQFMDESGYIYPTCGDEKLSSDDECFGIIMKEDEYIPVELLTHTQFDSDDNIDLETE